MRKVVCFGAMMAMAGSALAGSGGAGNVFSIDYSPETPVAAIQASYEHAAGKAVRLIIYDAETTFLTQARSKLEAAVDESGRAIFPLSDLEPGVYAFAAYLDVNGDGVLNRGKVLGLPKEPVAFSNGAKSKLRKPSFDEAKVKVEPGSIVLITLED